MCELYRVVVCCVLKHFLDRDQWQCTIPMTILASFDILVDRRTILCPAANWNAITTICISTFFVVEVHVNVRELDDLRIRRVCLLAE